MSDPTLAPEHREALVKELMYARRAVREAIRTSDKTAEIEARRKVDQAKRKLGERGPVWWTDGAPDYNRHMAKNTPYAEWFTKIENRIS